MKRKLRFINQSTVNANFCIFPLSAKSNITNPSYCIWLSAKVCPMASADFEWQEDLCFSYFEPVAPSNGSLIKISGTTPLNTDTGNTIVLNYENNSISFTQTGTFKKGELLIKQPPHFPNQKNIMVGVGMCNLPALMFDAQPNIDLIISPAIDYSFLLTSHQTGDLVPVTDIDGSLYKIKFPNNNTAIQVVMDGANTFNISYF